MTSLHARLSNLDCEWGYLQISLLSRDKVIDTRILSSFNYVFLLVCSLQCFSLAFCRFSLAWLCAKVNEDGAVLYFVWRKQQQWWQHGKHDLLISQRRKLTTARMELGWHRRHRHQQLTIPLELHITSAIFRPSLKTSKMYHSLLEIQNIYLPFTGCRSGISKPRTVSIPNRQRVSHPLDGRRSRSQKRDRPATRRIQHTLRIQHRNMAHPLCRITNTTHKRDLQLPAKVRRRRQSVHCVLWRPWNDQ